MPLEKTDWNKYEPALRRAPQSHHIRSFLCDNCNHVHLVLFDANDTPIAHATISEEILDGVLTLHEIAVARTI